MSGRILVVTHFPSPYQVELFDRIAQHRAGLAVAYLNRQDRGRQWANAKMAHEALFVDDEAQWRQCGELNRSATLVVYNYYQDQRLLQLLRGRARSGAPWAFWGERPGFKNEVLGRIARKFALRALHNSQRPIWGIGCWAVDAYEAEFGDGHPYVNLPYFSNLDRYAGAASAPREEPLLFVYSGSLSRRKGVDLLAIAFARLAQLHPHVRLRVVGSGELEPSMRQTLAPVANRVEMRGFKDWSEAPMAYAGGHILCVPSRHDGWALVVPEGLAAGLPVIATERVGATHDLVSGGRNGWVVAADDENALFQAMQSAARLSTEEWSAMSDAARCSVASHTLDAGAVRFLAAADEAVAGAR